MSPKSALFSAILVSSILPLGAFAQVTTATMIQIGDADQNGFYSTGLRDESGGELQAVPVLIAEHRDGSTTVQPVAPAGKIHDLGYGILPYGSVGLDSADLVTASLGIVFGHLTAQDDSNPENAHAGIEHWKYQGILAEGSVGVNGSQFGVGVGSLQGITILWIIPLPYAVSWTAEGVVYHTTGSHGLDIDTDSTYAGAQGSVSLDLMRVSVAVMKKVSESDGNHNLIVKAGLGLGF